MDKVGTKYCILENDGVSLCVCKHKPWEQLQRAKAELKKYEDMAKKGLEEFKDVGGCWGCGLQLQLNQDMEDIKQLKAENERLKEENKQLEKEVETWNYQADKRAELSNIWFNTAETYKQALQEIKKYIAKICKEECGYVQKKRCLDSDCRYGQILDKINEVIGAE